LRKELARLAGRCHLCGGAKLESGKETMADGAIEEFELAKRAGAFLLPIAATGGAAKNISDKLIGSGLSATGPTQWGLPTMNFASYPTLQRIPYAYGARSRHSQTSCQARLAYGSSWKSSIPADGAPGSSLLADRCHEISNGGAEDHAGRLWEGQAQGLADT
jgi:hypothetical protein